MSQRARLRLLALAAVAAVLGLLWAGPAGRADDPCTIDWDGGAGTIDWADAANWTGDRLPGAADTACIGAGAGVRFGNSTTQVAGLRVDGSLAIVFSELEVLGTRDSEVAGTLTVSGSGRLAVDRELHVATLSQTGGIVRGDGSLVTPDFRWSGGRQQGSGSTDVAPGGAGLALAPGEHVLDQARTLRVRPGAEALWTGGDVELDDHAVLANAGLLDVRGDLDLTGCCSIAPQVVNEAGGTIRKSEGAGVSDVTYPVVNDGAIEVASGGLAIEDGSVPDRASAGSFDVADGATLRFTGGTAALDAGSSVVTHGAGEVRLTGGRTHFAGDVDAAVVIDGAAAYGFFESPVTLQRLTLRNGFVAGGAALSAP